MKPMTYREKEQESKRRTIRDHWMGEMIRECISPRKKQTSNK